MANDEELLERLGRVLSRTGGPPVEQVEATKGLFTWRTVDAELAALTYDSLVAEDTGVRAVEQPRILTFEAEGMTVEMEIDELPGARRLIGQLTPPGPARLELRSRNGDRITGAADDFGRFVLALGPVLRQASLRCVRGDLSVETAWILL